MNGRRGGGASVVPLASAAEEVFILTDADFTAQILRIHDAVPDVSIIYGFPAPSAHYPHRAAAWNFREDYRLEYNIEPPLTLQ